MAGVFAWTDSTIVLSWLSNPHTSFKTFVSNRVFQIQSTIPNCQWLHVRSESNPADCASRGLLPAALEKSTLYWKGPSFLLSPVDSWPKGDVKLTLNELLEVQPVCLLTQTKVPDEWYARFSSFDQMIRVVARLRRFMLRCQKKDCDAGFLKQTELNSALCTVVKSAQKCFLRELLNNLNKSEEARQKGLARLSSFLDPLGAIRVGGRLQISNWSECRRYPMFIPKESHLAVLITRH